MNILWSDRKRWLGLPLTFTKYSLSDDRLFCETGLFTLKEEEVLLYRVSDISLTRSLGQRLFGVGTVCVMSSDKTCPHLDLVNVKNPKDVKEMVFEKVEAAKLARRMRTTEILDDDLDGDGIDDHDDAHDDCDHHHH